MSNEPHLNESLLEEKLTELEQARSWSPRVTSKLEALIRSGDDYALFKINPFLFASEKNIPDREAIDLFLHATHLGIFQMSWQLVCPACGDIVESFAALRILDTVFHCDLCRLDSEAQLDDYIQVTFTVSPQILPISFHRPETLSVEDYYLKYRFTKGATVAEGVPFVDFMRRQARVAAYLEPGEIRSFEFKAEEGLMLGTDLINRAGFDLNIEGREKKDHQSLAVVFSDSRFDPSSATLAPGKVALEIRNQSTKRASLALVQLPRTDCLKTGLGLEFPPFLSGKQLLTTQTFRDLFRAETIRSNEGLAVRDLTLLFTDLKGSTALYERIGDLRAFQMVQQHFDHLGRAIQEFSGALVKTIGDAVMATFLNPRDALNAALLMLEEIEGFNRDHGARELILKIGIHKGATIAVTLNDRLDYFGQTVNIAARVQGLADADEIYITEDIYSYPEVAELLVPYEVAAEAARLKGIREEIRVYRIAPAVVAGQAR